jgi:serine/threonine-protein kinase
MLSIATEPTWADPEGPTLRRGSAPAFGRYEVIGRLGGGGMGALYLARQRGPEGIQRQVALKVMLPELSLNVPHASRMFLEEMRVLLSINHNNVVRVVDFGDEQGTLFMVMEYLQGVTLVDLDAQARERGRALPTDLVAALIGQACRGLHAAHELRNEQGQLRGIVHRDVSPQNIMCTRDGTVKVIDFGIAWAIDRRIEPTASREIKGKLAYMAPEQLQAQPVTRAADIFALGVILHELLSGRRLFRRDDCPATYMAVMEGHVPPLREIRPDVPERLEETVRRALSKDPALRQESAARLGDELDRIVADAGGRFATPEAVAQGLCALEVNLVAPPPAPLLERPWFVKGAEDRAPAEPRRSGGPAQADPTDIAEICAPPPGSSCERTLPSGRRLVIQSIALDAQRGTSPAALRFVGAPRILPAALLLWPHPTSLVIEIDRRDLAGEGHRPSIYHNANNPSTRCESFHLPAVMAGASFDVGHRKARVQQVHCDSNGWGGADRLQVLVPRLGVVITSAEPARQLAVLYAEDATTGAVHMASVSVH